jgi:hypothetical protein
MALEKSMFALLTFHSTVVCVCTCVRMCAMRIDTSILWNVTIANVNFLYTMYAHTDTYHSTVECYEFF